MTLAIVIRAARQQQHRGRLLRRAAGPSRGARTASPSPATTCRRPRFLGIAGAIAINGYDGFLYSIGFLVAWLVALLLVAELLRNTGRFTMADVLSFRLRQRPVRMAAAISTLVVSFFYLLAQMAGAGGLVALLLGHRGQVGQSVVIAVVGVDHDHLRARRRHEGHDLGADRQGGAAHHRRRGHDGLGAGHVRLQPVRAARRGGRQPRLAGEKLLNPGLQYGKSTRPRSTSSRSRLALVLGTAGLPHVLMRFYTVPSSKQARKSVEWAIWLIGIFYLFTLVLGFGAAALVGPDAIKAAPGKANSAAPLLAFELGGELLLGADLGRRLRDDPRGGGGPDDHGERRFAHDVYAQVIKRGKVSADGEVRVARITAAGHRFRRDHRRHLRQRPEHRLPRRPRVRDRREREPADDPVLAVLGAVQHPRRAVEHLRRADLVDHPDRLQPGRLRQAGRPGHRPSPSMITDATVDFHWFPLDNPGIVSIPLGFFLGWLGTVTARNAPTRPSTPRWRSAR